MGEIRVQWKELKASKSREEIKELLADTMAELMEEHKKAEEMGMKHNVDLASFHEARTVMADVALKVRDLCV